MHYAEFQVCRKYLRLALISCLQVVFPPPCQHDMMLLFLKQPDFKMSEGGTCMWLPPVQVNTFYLR